MGGLRWTHWGVRGASAGGGLGQSDGTPCCLVQFRRWSLWRDCCYASAGFCAPRLVEVRLLSQVQDRVRPGRQRHFRAWFAKDLQISLGKLPEVQKKSWVSMIILNSLKNFVKEHDYSMPIGMSTFI